MTREAEQRESRLRDDMEKLRIQEEQTLETLDIKIDAMMEMRTQAIMDRAAARDALNRVQQELKTKEIEQKVKLELENEKLREKRNTFEATEVEETKAPSAIWKQNTIDNLGSGTPANARRKEKPQELATKKMKAVTDETCEPEPVTAADDFKVDYRAAARDALNRVQQELVTNEIEQKVKLELENEKPQEKLNAFEATEVEKTKAPSSLSMKLNVISGQRFADIKNPRHEAALSVEKASKARLLSEAEVRRKEKPQELATKKMKAVTDETCEPEPLTAADDFKVDYRAAARDALNRVQQELVTNEIEQKVKLELENEKPQEKLNAFEATEVEKTKASSSLSMKLNVISGQRTYVTTDSDQLGQIYLGEEELKFRRIGHDGMMEQDAVHIGYEADVTAHLLDTNGKKIGVTGLLDTRAVVSVMPIKTWERMGFTREDPILTNLRLAAANRGANYVA
ncbi:uncharacterized protein LOC134857628 [Symsagittifera roscoffensis]|uniref:uncharacterized protein LOC134857612 n=1 Tax=Symsagittifera roscoffensis TaxID=84072 RepID=UPI00307BD5C1